MLRTNVAVIGGGPVGLFGCLLLEKFGIDFACFQKSQKLRSHPSAHWVSARSKQIFSQIQGFSQRIDSQQQDYNNFRYYRYCHSVGGQQFGKKDHFTPSILQKLKYSSKYFGQFPNHISQSKLLGLEYQHLKLKNQIFFNQQIKDIRTSNNQYILTNCHNQVVGKSKYVILCNGFNSALRDSLNIKVGGGKQYYKLINIHFKSLELAKLIKQNSVQAMLHFIYNEKIPCVLVNHSLNEGQFVLQIPNYQPFIDLLAVYTPEQLIQTAILPSYFQQIKRSLMIIKVGRWKLQAQIAQRMHHQKIFLAGDTSHTYTPAGGFGMNCGFQDMNQLIHTIHTLERNPQAKFDSLARMYESDRINTNQKYLEKSLRNYQITDFIASQLGFPSSLTQYFFKFCRFLPQLNIQAGMQFNQQMRLIAMKSFFQPKKIQPKLDLFFDEYDYQVQRLSKYLPTIIQSMNQNRVYDLWISQDVKKQQIYEIFGRIKQENICRVALPNGERIVRRDGIVVLSQSDSNRSNL